MSKIADLVAAEGVTETFKQAQGKEIVIENSVKEIKKSTGAFRTISEVAADLNVQQHVLRFWETKFSQIKPLKRGGGRRYYRPEDVLIIKKIHNLLYTQGYTIKGVQKLLKGQSKSQIIKDSFAENRKTLSPSNDVVIEKDVQPEIKKEIVEVHKRSLSDNQKSMLESMLKDLKEFRDDISGKSKPIFEDVCN